MREKHQSNAKGGWGKRWSKSVFPGRGKKCTKTDWVGSTLSVKKPLTNECELHEKNGGKLSSLFESEKSEGKHGREHGGEGWLWREGTRGPQGGPSKGTLGKSQELIEPSGGVDAVRRKEVRTSQGIPHGKPVEVELACRRG